MAFNCLDRHILSRPGKNIYSFEENAYVGLNVHGLMSKCTNKVGGYQLC